MQFGCVVVYVPHVENSVIFYQSVFGATCSVLTSCKQYAEILLGQTKIGFAQETCFLDDRSPACAQPFHINRLDACPGGFEIAFVATDVAQAYQDAVKKGATALCAPVVKPWGQTVGYVRDLNGVRIQIGSPCQPQ
jgi:lactoylglutathione lyase